MATTAVEAVAAPVPNPRNVRRVNVFAHLTAPANRVDRMGAPAVAAPAVSTTYAAMGSAFACPSVLDRYVDRMDAAECAARAPRVWPVPKENVPLQFAAMPRQ